MKWKITPAKPTPEMQNRGCDARLNGEAAAGIYHAMLSAAPDPLEDAELVERGINAIVMKSDIQMTSADMETIVRAVITAMKGE